ncbi:hypothetical protein LZG04_27935 [Saccharothrix sp. S26]|uniref:hypothetical protein n=1 Tax=Saccharothrix sp. S26 TaxID=2907215 RepID=UPI001F2BFC4D|nr:hypothetical protein [Saccharothrix sp. S26]MCE6998601.1 hypothetical protein [Saccharothrix sp. S26]
MVLAVAHTVASGQRVLDALSVIESEPEVQVVFTSPPDKVGSGVDQFLRRAAALTIPWHDAIGGRFDLVVTASSRTVGDLGGGPVLLLPDSAPRRAFPDVPGYDGLTGIKQALARPGGTAHPLSVVGLAHHEQHRLLRDRWSGAARHAIVIGDMGFDRLAASMRLRERYRSVLGVDAGRPVLLVSSGRGPQSLFARAPGLLDRLVTELPDHLVVCQLHPDVWDVHGRRQILAWTADVRQAGLVVVPPDADWRIPLVAADRVIGDNGPVTAYAVAIGKPVALARAAPLVPPTVRVLDPSRPLRDQLDEFTSPLGAARAATDRLTSVPHRAATVLRATCGRAMRLPDLGTPSVCRPVPVDRFSTSWSA